MNNILKGTGHAPIVVALARGFAEAVLLAAVGAAAIFLVGIDFEAFGASKEVSTLIIIPGIWKGVRVVEGIFDQIDPAKDRANRDVA